MARDHPLGPTVQAAMRRLMECGWVEHFVRKEGLIGDLTGDPSGGKNGRALEVSQLIGAFVMLIILLFFTIIAFIGELTWARRSVLYETAKRLHRIMF